MLNFRAQPELSSSKVSPRSEASAVAAGVSQKTRGTKDTVVSHDISSPLTTRRLLATDDITFT